MATAGSKETEELKAQIKTLSDDVGVLTKMLKELAESTASDLGEDVRAKVEEMAERTGKLKRDASAKARAEAELDRPSHFRKAGAIGAYRVAGRYHIRRDDTSVTGLGTMFLTFAKLAGSAGVSQLTDVRRRAVKGLVAGVVIWTAVVLALGFALASGAVWMSQFMSFAAALLVIAGALVALALIVYLIALRPPRRTQPDIKAALSEAESALARTDPMTMVLTAVVLGFLVGRRGRK